MTLAPRTLYIGAMILAGLALALLSLRFPGINDGAAPPLMILIGVSLLIELVLMVMAGGVGRQPLTMDSRIIGFFAGALLYLGLRLVLV